MKMRKCTTGLVVSFFFAAAMVVTLHTTAGALELTAASKRSILTQPVLSVDSGEKQKKENCKKCNWGED